MLGFGFLVPGSGVLAQQPPPAAARTRTASYELTDGRTIEGVFLNHERVRRHTAADDERIDRPAQKIRRTAIASSRRASTGRATTGRRQATATPALTQIDKSNVGRLAPRWIYTIPTSLRLQVTPVVVDGVMYVTSANECYALDAGNGREIWRFQQPRTKGLVGNAAGGINRGVAVAGERVFMVTDHAHLVALNRFTGELLWDTEMADWRQNYNATSAPLIVGDFVVAGTAGGEQGVRGFLAAYDQATGKEAWRFWTVPKPGEPGSETWMGAGIEQPGGTTWMTGVYDAALGLVYWTTGNPSPDYNGDERLGDNLYASSVVALDARSGRLKWHFQFTPHNVWDWDAQQPTVLIDATWEGRPRKLLVQASRNGFFYVLDRTDGKFLLGKPFVSHLTWAREIGADGRPVLVPGQEPSAEGTRVCPSAHGAANWYSTSYSPADRASITCRRSRTATCSSRASASGSLANRTGAAPRGPIPQRRTRKSCAQSTSKTGKVAWELPQTGPGGARGGTLATASGLLFFCDDQDRFAAVDASTGKPLWQFGMNSVWRASPMTYEFDGRQHVAIASGSNIVVFGLTGP